MSPAGKAAGAAAPQPASARGTEFFAMNIAHRCAFLSVFAIAEGATGLGLLILPSIVFALLFGTRTATPEAAMIGRICGAALLALAVASWAARDAKAGQGNAGMLVGVALYNSLATALLAYSALVLERTGSLLWPAVLYHAAISLWCLAWRVPCSEP